MNSLRVVFPRHTQLAFQRCLPLAELRPYQTSSPPLQIQFQKALKAALPNMDSPTAGQPIIIEAVAPMHGPCVRYSVVELLRKYRQASGHPYHAPCQLHREGRRTR